MQIQPNIGALKGFADTYLVEDIATLEDHTEALLSLGTLDPIKGLYVLDVARDLLRRFRFAASQIQAIPAGAIPCPSKGPIACKECNEAHKDQKRTPYCGSDEYVAAFRAKQANVVAQRLLRAQIVAFEESQ